MESIRSVVLLLARPPYLRWSVATLIVIAALLWELSDRATESVPFANAEIARGEVISDDHIEWRDIPFGAFSPADLVGAMALVDIREGDPLTSSVAGSGSTIPQGWWSVPVDLPPGVPVGSAVRLTTDDGSSVDGVIAIAASSDQFGIAVPGAVAVPEQAVDMVAVAAASGSLLVVVAP
ncbi:MAG: SAF domain-containing protein [Acidimicrobiia bacterium]